MQKEAFAVATTMRRDQHPSRRSSFARCPMSPPIDLAAQRAAAETSQDSLQVDRIPEPLRRLWHGSVQSAVENYNMVVENRNVALMLFTVTLSLLGFTMVQPVGAKLRDLDGLTGPQVGSIFSAQAKGLMIAGLAWPSMSDILGRRKVLIVAHILSAIGYLIQGVAIAEGWPFNRFLALRFVTGIVTANCVFKAYIGASVPAEKVAQVMVCREGAASVATVVGPWLTSTVIFKCCGGGVDAVLYTVAAFHVLCAVLTWFTKEYHKPGSKAVGAVAKDLRKRLTSMWKRLTSMTSQGLRKLFSEKWFWSLAGIYLSSVAYVNAQLTFASFFSCLLHDQLHVEVDSTGDIMGMVSGLKVLFLVFLYKPLRRRLGFDKTAVLSGLCLVLGMATFGKCQSLGTTFWLAASLCAFGNTVLPSTVPTLIAQTAQPAILGTAIGLDSVFNNFGRALVPTLLGHAYDKDPGLCFRFASGSVLVSVMLFISVRLLNRDKILS